MSNTHLSSTRFDQLNLEPSLLQGVTASGFEFCTPIQAMALPIALQGKDVSGQAQTGTGKTAAFLIACMNNLMLNAQNKKQSSHQNPIRSLILAPTRELAIQIYEDGKPLAKHTDLKLGIAYGGTNYDKQRDQIAKGVDILIGTPGRIIDYFKQGVFSIDALEVMVLDEADRMFDLGFIDDIRFLLRKMPPPKERLSLLFSATLSLKVGELAYEHMNEPEIVKIESDAITADRITEKAYMPSNDEKIPLLLGLVNQLEKQKAVVFTNTKHQAEKIEAWLNENSFKCAMLSGDVPQRKRESLLKSFKDGKTTVLVATDVAARGLHIPDVSCVINFDLPTDAEDYVHRIGRTARAGATGTAISLICETYAMSLIDIEEYIEHSIPVEKSFEDILFKEAKTPDLSNLRSNRKPKRGSNDKKHSTKNGAKNGAKKSVVSKDKQDKRTPRNKSERPDNGRRKKVSTLGPDSPEAKDAKTLAALENKSAPKKIKTPLRGRSLREVPAVG